MDPRYFYFAVGRGHCITNGFATVSRFLREAGKNHMRLLLTPAWFEAMQTFAHNPSVLGFLVEEMIIQSIVEISIVLPDSLIRVPQKPGIVKYFFDPDQLPTTIRSQEYALYVPKKFNFQHVDCVFVHINPNSNETVIMPIQITIAQRHKCSDAEFFLRRGRIGNTPFDGLVITSVQHSCGSRRRRYLAESG